jgi:hypothetical protein
VLFDGADDPFGERESVATICPRYDRTAAFGDRATEVRELSRERLLP